MRIARFMVAMLLAAGLSLAQAETIQRFIVGFEPGSDPEQVIAGFTPPQAVRLEVLRPLGAAFIVSLSPVQPLAMAEQIASALAREPGVAFAELSRRVNVKFTPNELATSGQWYLTESYGIQAQSAWDVTRGSNSVVIAVLDTGTLGHADIDASRILPGYDFISSAATANDGDGRDADPTDPGDAVAANECGAGTSAAASSWHGLHVTGVLGATVDNGMGVVGINHFSRILPVRVLGKCGGDFVDILEAMLWAAGLPVSGVPANPYPAKVINMSFGGSGSCSAAIQSIIDQVVAAGAVVVAAAGNENGVDVATRVPAGCNNVITVAATDRAGDRASYTNIGSLVALAAPGGASGDGIRSTSNTGLTVAAFDTYKSMIGSSFSAAMVSGGASLLLSLNSGLTPAEVRNVLVSNVQPFPAGSTCTTALCGAGILNLSGAVTAVSAASVSSGASSGGGGGGGCTLGVTAHRDWSWVLIAVLLVLLRNRQKLSD